MKINLRSYKSLFSVKQVAMIAVAVVICLIATASFVYSTMRKDIIISDIDGNKKISTFKNTVADVLKEKNISLRPQDRLNVAMTEKLEDGTNIKISRARNITVHADGKDITLLTVAPDVKSVLQEAKIKLEGLDRVEPGLTAAVDAGTAVSVVRVEEKTLSQVVKVEPGSEVRFNPSLEKGLAHVVQKGQSGKKELSIKLVFENGKEVSRQIVGEKILVKPVNNITEEGTKTTLVASRGQLRRFTRAMKMVATAYDASYESCGKRPSDPNYGITATGMQAKPGIVAVDPKVIPLGTWLYIEGYGEALAADTGGSIKGNRIDLFYDSKKAVDRYGRKTLKVYILDKPRYQF